LVTLYTVLQHILIVLSHDVVFFHIRKLVKQLCRPKVQSIFLTFGFESPARIVGHMIRTSCTDFFGGIKKRLEKIHFSLFCSFLIPNLATLTQFNPSLAITIRRIFGLLFRYTLNRDTLTKGFFFEVAIRFILSIENMLESTNSIH